MVACMAMRAEDIGNGLTPIGRVDEVASDPEPTRAEEVAAWRMRHEREVARAETAEARAEECRWAAVAARAELGSLKAQFQANREKLAEAREEVKAIRRAVWVSRRRGEALEGQVGRLRANGQRLSRRLRGESSELRKALRRSRRHKAAIGSLSRDNARLRKAVRKGQKREVALETELAEVRASRAVLSKWLYGRRSEQQDKPCSKRRRGQQPGAPGHGRTRGRRSRNGPRSTNRRSRRGCAAVAARGMWPMASVARGSWRST